MKKIIKSILFAFVLVLTGTVFAACGPKAPKVESIYVDIGTVEYVTIKHKSSWDPSEELTIKAKLSDGTEKTIDGDDCDFSSINTNTVGLQELTVTYGTYEAKVDVMVEKYATQIFVKSGSIDTEVNHNAVLDTTNAKVLVKYSDNSMEEISEGFVVDIPNTSIVGTASVEIHYNGLTCIHNYTVNKKLMSLTVAGNYAKSHKYNGASVSTYNYAPVTALAVWSDSEVPEVVTYENLTFVNKIIENQKGNQTFTISYGGLTANSEVINVYTELETIEYYSGIADNTKYGTLTTQNVVVVAVYTDLLTTPITVANGLVVEYDETALGNVVVTLRYSENNITKTITKTTNVYEEYESLIVEAKDPATSKYFLTGTDFDKTKFNYFAQYTKNRNVVAASNIVVSEVKNEDSQKYVEVSYTIESTVGWILWWSRACLTRLTA